jgi:hypothetical protein
VLGGGRGGPSLTSAGRREPRALSGTTLQWPFSVVPKYALEIHEPDGSITKPMHATREDQWMQIGQFFRYEGRLLRVTEVREVPRPRLCLFARSCRTPNDPRLRKARDRV